MGSEVLPLVRSLLSQPTSYTGGTGSLSGRLGAEPSGVGGTGVLLPSLPSETQTGVFMKDPQTHDIFSVPRIVTELLDQSDSLGLPY